MEDTYILVRQTELAASRYICFAKRKLERRDLRHKSSEYVIFLKVLDDVTKQQNQNETYQQRNNIRFWSI
jgi:hypothetical protein